MPKDLVLYFSLTGNTERIAKIIKKKKDVELIRIGGKPLPFLVPVYYFLQASKQKVVKIPKINLGKYNKIYLGGPVWVSKPCPPLEYIAKNINWKNTNVVLFIHYTQNPGMSLNELKNIINERGGTIVGSVAIKQNEPEAEILKKI